MSFSLIPVTHSYPYCLLSLRCRVSELQKEYLKEPTEEFKAMEARQSDFAAAQRAYKQEFVKKLDVSTSTVQDISKKQENWCRLDFLFENECVLQTSRL